MAKMWAGRFSKEINGTVNAFNASIYFDQRLYPQDIEGSLAHSEMLARQGIISEEDKKQIHQGLKEIKEALDQKEIILDERYEDIHMAIEQILTEKSVMPEKDCIPAAAAMIRLHWMSGFMSAKNCLK